MTKTGKRFVDTPGQMSLFDSIRLDREERQAQRQGRLCVSAKLHSAVKAALKKAHKSVEAVADEMTALTGGEVTASMLYNITAASHPHRLPAELLPALCVATGDFGPLLVLTDTAGVYTVEPPEKIRAKIHSLEEQKKELDREKHKYSALLHELEGHKQKLS